MPAKTVTKTVTKKADTKAAKPAKGAKKAPVKAKAPPKDTITLTSPARVRQHINFNGVNREIHSKLTEFQKENEKHTSNKQLTAIKEDESLSKKFMAILKFNPGNPPEKADTKEKKDKWREAQLEAHKKAAAAAIKKDAKLAVFAKDFNVHEARRVIANDLKRFSKGSYVALAAIIDEIVRSILRTAMDVVIDHKKKMLSPAYCVTQDMEKSDFYCLFANVKPFVDARNRLRELAEQNDEEESEQPKGKKGKKAAVKPAKDEEESEEEGEDVAVTRTFEHYVGNIAKSITADQSIKNNPYSVVRMSKEVKIFCSNIIIAILANLGQALCRSMGNAKTINETIIRNAFATIMTYNGADPSNLLKHVDAALAKLEKAKSSKAKAGAAKAKTAAKPGKPAVAEESEDDDEDDESSDSE
jgi:hypothetical protein